MSTHATHRPLRLSECLRQWARVSDRDGDPCGTRAKPDCRERTRTAFHHKRSDGEVVSRAPRWRAKALRCFGSDVPRSPARGAQPPGSPRAVTCASALAAEPEKRAPESSHVRSGRLCGGGLLPRPATLARHRHALVGVRPIPIASLVGTRTRRNDARHAARWRAYMQCSVTMRSE